MTKKLENISDEFLMQELEKRGIDSIVSERIFG